MPIRSEGKRTQKVGSPIFAVSHGSTKSSGGVFSECLTRLKAPLRLRSCTMLNMNSLVAEQAVAHRQRPEHEGHEGDGRDREGGPRQLHGVET